MRCQCCDNLGHFTLLVNNTFDTEMHACLRWSETALLFRCILDDSFSVNARRIVSTILSLLFSLEIDRSCLQRVQLQQVPGYNEHFFLKKNASH